MVNLSGMIRKNREDYLRAIYDLYENSRDKSIVSTEIARHMGVSKAAVSKMLRKMTAVNLVKMSPYSKIRLTAGGLREARKLTYKYRIVEVFLLDVLKVDRRKIRQEAHDLEHCFSDQTIKKLAGFLGDPEVCPCGHKIPKIN